jgi:hypothetical protein
LLLSHRTAHQQRRLPLTARPGLFAQPGRVRLFFVAQQRGLAMHCEGYEVDEERFKLVMEDILSEIAEFTEPDQNNLPLDRVPGSYAMVMGGQIAAAAYDRETYCARGEDLRVGLAGDTEGKPSVLVTAD